MAEPCQNVAGDRSVAKTPGSVPKKKNPSPVLAIRQATGEGLRIRNLNPTRPFAIGHIGPIRPLRPIAPTKTPEKTGSNQNGS
jgi:hypothetical protein